MLALALALLVAGPAAAQTYDALFDNVGTTGRLGPAQDTTALRAYYAGFSGNKDHAATVEAVGDGFQR